MTPPEQARADAMRPCDACVEDRFAAYYAAIAADNAYHAELVRVYGESKAGDARYSRDHTDAGVIAAYARKREADDVWRTYMIMGRI